MPDLTRLVALRGERGPLSSSAHAAGRHLSHIEATKRGEHDPKYDAPLALADAPSASRSTLFESVETGQTSQLRSARRRRNSMTDRRHLREAPRAPCHAKCRRRCGHRALAMPTGDIAGAHQLD